MTTGEEAEPWWAMTSEGVTSREPASRLMSIPLSSRGNISVTYILHPACNRQHIPGDLCSLFTHSIRLVSTHSPNRLSFSRPVPFRAFWVRSLPTSQWLMLRQSCWRAARHAFLLPSRYTHPMKSRQGTRLGQDRAPQAFRVTSLATCTCRVRERVHVCTCPREF